MGAGMVQKKQEIQGSCSNSKRKVSVGCMLWTIGCFFKCGCFSSIIVAALSEY